MQVKLIDHGVPADMLPKRAYANDVGADVYALKDRIIEVGCSAVIGLGFGLDLPAGFGAFIFPRSSQTAKGVDCKLPRLTLAIPGKCTQSFITAVMRLITFTAATVSASWSCCQS